MIITSHSIKCRRLHYSQAGKALCIRHSANGKPFQHRHYPAPHALPEKVVLLKLSDADSYTSIYRTIDQLQGISTEEWSKLKSAGNT